MQPVHLLPAQLVFGLFALAGAGLAPPSSGPVLLLPLPGWKADVATDARGLDLPILGTGPVGGSLIVMADRATFGAMIARGTLAVRGTATGCTETKA